MDIIENIRKGKYKTKVPFPNQRDIQTCKCGNYCSSSDKFCPKCGNEMGDLDAEYKYMLKAYREDGGRLCSKFEKDAIKDVGLSKHEAKSRAFSMAWSNGHASGMEEVYYHLTDIAHVITGE